MNSRIRQISDLGQAIWIDNISRAMLRRGELLALIAEGVAGVTSNPTIFQKAVSGGDAYDEQIRACGAAGRSAEEIYEALVVDDIAQAADQLRDVYNETHGRDGYVSLEVSPHLAHDSAGTVREARRLWRAVNRPNLMIKVPATPAGLPAIEELIGQGINVNVTLIFAVEAHERVMRAYLSGVRRLLAGGGRAARVSSVASFFVSRIDTAVDRLLRERIEAGQEELEGLLGRAAVANARLAYARYRAIFGGEEFAELRAAGARDQRPLWASTGTKNPAYSPTCYVDPLIGPNTVNTVPPATLEAIRASSLPAQTIEQELDQAREVFARLAAAGIEMAAVTESLLTEGVRLFAESYDRLLADVEAKRRRLVAA